MMRISTNLMFDSGTGRLLDRQSELVKLQQQISTGRRLLTPSDDPIASAAALDVTQAKAMNQQYRVNADSAGAALAVEEQALTDSTRLLQDMKVLAVNAGNAALSNLERASLAIEVEGRYQELMGIANRTDGKGGYLFSGYRGSTPPFAESAPGVIAYGGDQGVRQIQIGASRSIAVSDSGAAVFQQIRNGNGSFATAAGSNTGTGVISEGRVLDAAKWADAANSGDFTLRFHVDSSATPPVTTYDIVDDANNVSMLTGAAPAAGPYLRTYTPGAAISLRTTAPPDTNSTPFDFGAEVSVTGAPAGGDTFQINESTQQDIFATLHELASLLRAGITSAPGSAASYANRLAGSLTNLDNALDNVLGVRAAVGIRMREAEAAAAVSEELAVQHEQTLSRLQDLDYAQALSRLSLQQITLEAAQKSFVQITGLKLFDYL